MNKTIQTIVMAALCLIFNSKAQEPIKPPSLKNQVLIGKVISAATGESLPGAIIKVTTTNQTIVSNDSGDFVLSLSNGGYSLSVHYLNHKTKHITIQIPLKEKLIVSLENDDNPLDEVQIVGYGKTTKRLNTGSVSNITAKEIENQPVTNVLSALSGRMPGVFVQTTNGLPGGNINIQIRGKGSIAAGTDPLYIIDGVPFKGTAINAGSSLNTNNIAGTISPLNNLNPADIESITILKDADATSIYGSRGSNGVVLITTKAAKSGRSKLDVNMLHGFNNIVEKPNLLSNSEYLSLRREAFANDNKVPSSDPLSSNYAPDLTLWSQTENTDWVDHIFGNTAQSTNLQARLSGGKQNSTFSIAGNYHLEDTFLPGYNKYARTGLTSQFQHHSDNNKYSISISNQLSSQLNDLSNLVTTIQTNFLKAPNYPLHLPDGSLNSYGGPNILAEINARSKSEIENSISNMNFRYTLLPGLNFKVNMGYNKSNYRQTLIFPSRSLFNGSINYTNFGDNSSKSFIVEPQLDYVWNLKAASISFLVGSTLQNQSTTTTNITANNFTQESLMENLGSGTITNRASGFTKYKYASLFGRLTYNLNDRYMLNATIRRDGSSRFGAGNRFGNFGSLGASWIFSNLHFLRDKVHLLRYGKLRASYGTTGNDQIPDYAYLSTYIASGVNYQDVSTLRPFRVNNENFHWETTRKTNIGIDLGFFKDQVLISADYYINKSKDQLVQYTLPVITGFTGYQANLPAVIINSGWEWSVSTKLIDKQLFKWSSNFNLTLPKNELKYFSNFSSSSYAATYELGYDITRIKGYKYLGVDPITGNPRYADHNGIASNTPYPNFTLGKQTPDFYGGFGNNLSFKAFELIVFAQFVKQISKGGLMARPGVGVINNFSFVNDRWSVDNPTATLPRATTNSDFYFANSSINIFDTSFIRIKNITVSYRIPNLLVQKIGLQNLRVFAEGQNLLTIWNRNAAVVDPETGPTTSGGSRNIPLSKSLVFGLQFTL